MHGGHEPFKVEKVLHDGMQYDPIQGQGHEPFKVKNSAIFEGLFTSPIYNGAGK